MSSDPDRRLERADRSRCPGAARDHVLAQTTPQASTHKCCAHSACSRSISSRCRGPVRLADHDEHVSSSRRSSTRAARQSSCRASRRDLGLAADGHGVELDREPGAYAVQPDGPSTAPPAARSSPTGRATRRRSDKPRCWISINRSRSARCSEPGESLRTARGAVQCVSASRTRIRIRSARSSCSSTASELGALPGIANEIVATLGKQTSLQLLGPDQTRAVYGDHLEQVDRAVRRRRRVHREDRRRRSARPEVDPRRHQRARRRDPDDAAHRRRRPHASKRAHRGLARERRGAARGSQLDDYLARLLPPTDFLRFGVIDIIATETGALVTIGGKTARLDADPAAQAARAGDVRHPRREARLRAVHDADRSCRRTPSVKVEARPRRSAVGGRAWYQHWYVLAARQRDRRGRGRRHDLLRDAPPPATHGAGRRLIPDHGVQAAQHRRARPRRCPGSSARGRARS